MTTHRAPIALFAGLLALAAPAGADTVLLKNGSRVSGKIVESNDRQIVVEISEFGRLTLKRGEIDEVVKAPAPSELPVLKETPESPAAGAKPAAGGHAAPAPAEPAEPKPAETPAAAATTPATPPKAPETPAASPLEAALRSFRDTTDPAERQKLVEAIAQTGPEAVPAMLAMLDTADPAMTGAVVNAVIRLRGPETLGLVLPKARSEKASARAAAATLLGILGKSVDPDARIKREDPLKKGKPETAAPEKPAAPGEEIDERAVTALRGLVQDPDASVRAAALSGLASLHDTESMEVIVGRLADGESIVRDRAQAALLDLLPRLEARDRERLPRQLVDLLRSQDRPDILDALLKTTGELGQKIPLEDDRLIEVVTSLFRHDDQSVRAQAFIAIGRVAPTKSLEILTTRLTAEPEPWCRIQIMTAMTLSGNKKAIPPLIDVLERDDSQQMKDAAVRSLQQLTKQYYGGDVQKWRAWWGRAGGQAEEPPPAEKPHAAPASGPAPKH